MTEYCKNCGSELSEGAIFCDECGTKTTKKTFSANNGLFNSYNIDMIDGEYVIRQSQVNRNCLIPPFIVFGIGILFGFFNTVIVLSSFSWYYDPIGAIIFGFLNILTILGLIWFIIRFIAYKTNDLILTNKRVFGKCGLISTTQMQSPLNKMDSVSFTNGLIGKLLGYGTVKIATTSSVFKFRFLCDGQTWYNDIFNQLENSEIEKRENDAKAIAEALSKD